MIEKSRKLSGIKDLPSEAKELALFRVSGIYFLFKGDEIVYIGKSVNIQTRVDTHAGYMDFDRVFYLRANSPQERSALEEEYILRFKPEKNRCHLIRHARPSAIKVRLAKAAKQPKAKSPARRAPAASGPPYEFLTLDDYLPGDGDSVSGRDITGAINGAFRSRRTHE